VIHRQPDQVGDSFGIQASPSTTGSINPGVADLLVQEAQKRLQAILGIRCCRSHRTSSVLLTGAEALEPRDGWTLELLAGNGILWRWSKATRMDAWTWRVVGDPEWEEAST
jgi:hypothetical protein